MSDRCACHAARRRADRPDERWDTHGEWGWPILSNFLSFASTRSATGEPKSVDTGDLVQWTSGGVDQFETPRRVQSVHRRDGKEWAFVEGTSTGVPLSELTVVTPKSDAASRPSPTAPSGPIAVPSMTKEREYLRGLLSRDTGYRLLVSGDIGPKELGKMIKLLQAQKAILEDDTDKEDRDGT